MALPCFFCFDRYIFPPVYLASYYTALTRVGPDSASVSLSYHVQKRGHQVRARVRSRICACVCVIGGEAYEKGRWSKEGSDERNDRNVSLPPLRSSLPPLLSLSTPSTCALFYRQANGFPFCGTLQQGQGGRCQRGEEGGGESEREGERERTIGVCVCVCVCVCVDHVYFYDCDVRIFLCVYVCVNDCCDMDSVSVCVLHR